MNLYRQNMVHESNSFPTEEDMLDRDYPKCILFQLDSGCDSVVSLLKNRQFDLRIVKDIPSLESELNASAPDILFICSDEKSIPNWDKLDEISFMDSDVLKVALVNKNAFQNPDMIQYDKIDDIVYLDTGEKKIEKKLTLIQKRVYERKFYRNNQKELDYKTTQLTVIDEIVKRSLGGYDLINTFDYITQVMVEVLYIDYCEIIECRAGKDRFIIKSSFGNMDTGSQNSFHILSEDLLAMKTSSLLELIFIDDFNEVNDDIIPLYLKKYNILSGISIRIPGDKEPYGMMRVFSKKRRYFTKADSEFLQSVVNVLAVLIDRKKNECALRKSEETVRSILESSLEGIVTISEKGNILSFNKAAESIFGYDVDEIIGQKVSRLFPAPYGEEIISLFDDDSMQEEYSKDEVVGQRKNGISFPMEIDITKVDLEDVSFYTFFLRDVSARRQLEQEILEISEKERLRIGQDLHDGLGQMLTAIGLISQNLSKKMKEKKQDSAVAVGEIAEMIKDADHYARNLSRGLIPVSLESNGISNAIKTLTVNTQKFSGISCTYEEDGNPSISDNGMAMHLYRIAQEALNNIVKHSHASEIKVKLKQNNGQLELSVIDNGIGFPDLMKEKSGLGVRIMNYRAQMMGGKLTINRIDEGITYVTCTIPNAG